MNAELREELKLLEQAKATSVWYNPSTGVSKGDNTATVLPQTHYIGTKNNQPTWEEPVFDQRKYLQAKRLLKEGKINDAYSVKIDPFIGQWATIAHEYADLQEDAIKSGSKSSLKSAGVGMSSDFSTVDILNVQAEIVGTELR